MGLKNLFKNNQKDCEHQYELNFIKLDCKVYGNLFSSLFSYSAIKYNYEGNIYFCKKCGHTISPELVSF